MKNIHDYDDIISLPRHVSLNRRHMSNGERAAQFSPFAALTGYDDAIRETARLTDQRTVLSESELAVLNEKFSFLAGHIEERPEVTVTFFVKDEKKDGGRYETRTGRLRRLDPLQRILVFADRSALAIDDIYDIRSEILNHME